MFHLSVLRSRPWSSRFSVLGAENRILWPDAQKKKNKTVQSGAESQASLPLTGCFSSRSDVVGRTLSDLKKPCEK